MVSMHCTTNTDVSSSSLIRARTVKPESSQQNTMTTTTRQPVLLNTHLALRKTDSNPSNHICNGLWSCFVKTSSNSDMNKHSQQHQTSSNILDDLRRTTFTTSSTLRNGSRFYPLTCMISTLLFFIVLNIFLILWIVWSLNLHQNSGGFIRKLESTSNGKFTSAYDLDIMDDLDDEHYRLRVQGDLYIEDNHTLFTNYIENNNYKHQNDMHYFSPEPSMFSNEQSATPSDNSIIDDYNFQQFNYNNFLKILSSQDDHLTKHDDNVGVDDGGNNDGEHSFGHLELQSHTIDSFYGPPPNQQPNEHYGPNSIHLQSDGNIEFKINERLVIESEKPRRSLHVEQNRLIIEDSSPIMPHLQQQIGGLRMQQLNTESVVGCVHQDLRIESRMEKLKMKADDTVSIESNHGDIHLKSYGTLMVNGDQQINLDGRMILLANLNGQNQNQHYHSNTINNMNDQFMVHNKSSSSSWTQSESSPLAYQVCICQNGQLFLATETNLCQAGENICGETNTGANTFNYAAIHLQH